MNVYINSVESRNWIKKRKKIIKKPMKKQKHKCLIIFTLKISAIGINVFMLSKLISYEMYRTIWLKMLIAIAIAKKDEKNRGEKKAYRNCNFVYVYVYHCIL